MSARAFSAPPSAAGAGASRFSALAAAVVDELGSILSEVSTSQVEELVEIVRSVRRVACYGVGREGLAMRGFAMRLFHLGLQANVVGEVTCMALGVGDLLLVSAGPGYFSTVQALAQEARKAGAKVAALTAQREAPLNFADLVVRIPAHTLPSADADEQPTDAACGGDEQVTMSSPSALQMGSSYELGLQATLDCVSKMLQMDLQLSDDAMTSRHTNLE